MKVQIPVPETRLMEGTLHFLTPLIPAFSLCLSVHSSAQLHMQGTKHHNRREAAGKGTRSDKKIRVSKGAGRTIKKRTLLRASWTQNDHPITNHIRCTGFRHIFSCKALSNYVRQLCMVPLHTWKNQGSARKWDSEQVWLVQSCFPLQPWSSKDHKKIKQSLFLQLTLLLVPWLPNYKSKFFTFPHKRGDKILFWWSQ